METFVIRSGHSRWIWPLVRGSACLLCPAAVAFQPYYLAKNWRNTYFQAMSTAVAGPVCSAPNCGMRTFDGYPGRADALDSCSACCFAVCSCADGSTVLHMKKFATLLWAHWDTMCKVADACFWKQAVHVGVLCLNDLWKKLGGLDNNIEYVGTIGESLFLWGLPVHPKVWLAGTWGDSKPLGQKLG